MNIASGLRELNVVGPAPYLYPGFQTYILVGIKRFAKKINLLKKEEPSPLIPLGLSQKLGFGVFRKIPPFLKIE